MTSWMMVLTTTAIGSAIGGFTNRLAIQMLFRPFKEWRIGGVRVPFTPGLIPRRRAELGISMGRLVEDHLLTKEGIRRALTEGDLQRTLHKWLIEYYDQLVQSEQTLGDLLQRLLPDVITANGDWTDEFRHSVLIRWEGIIDHLRKLHADKTLRQLLSESGREKLDLALEEITEQLLIRFRMYLRSPDGISQLQGMLRNVMGGGGMFGGLVGMFLGDEKIVAKVQTQLDEFLQHPQLVEQLSTMLRHEVHVLLDKRVEDVCNWIGDAQLNEWKHRLFGVLEEQSLRLLDQPVQRIFGNLREPLAERYIPRFVNWLVTTLEHNVERLFDRMAIADIVARQVEGFPLERIEEMIIGISGKEFRMITLLGFILGGMIGFVQGLINLYFL